jgi:hypothetical protein
MHHDPLRRFGESCRGGYEMSPRAPTRCRDSRRERAANSTAPKEGKLFAVSFGRYNLVDLVDEDFFAGGGTDRFFNIAQIGPLTVVREVPLITNAISMAYVRGGDPFFTFAIMHPNDHSTDSGLSNLFADGVTFAPGVNFPTKYFGKNGKHSLGGAITTKRYTPFDSIRQLIIPGPPIRPAMACSHVGHETSSDLRMPTPTSVECSRTISISSRSAVAACGSSTRSNSSTTFISRRGSS